MKFEAVKDDYERLWHTMELKGSMGKSVDWGAAKILGGRARYQAVSEKTGVPWFMVGLMHLMEAGCDFSKHLHNGDPITKKTVNVPKGRPAGKGPWTWEESAVDAIIYDKLDKVTDWDLARVAYCLESFNGWGYRKYHPEVANPYLWSASPLIVIGDSISHYAFATTAADHWFNLISRFANAGIAKDEPIMTALRSSSSYTPAFYGVTTSGSTSTGTVGPIGESLILASGASLSFTGAYEQVDVFYTQQSGAGSITFSYNGGAAYKTVSAAGSTVLDSYTGPSLTSQAASGTYTIAASGGAVEITGLVRLGIKTASTPPRLLTMRAAHGGYTLTDFNAPRVTSILEQASYAGGSTPMVLIALGINDSFGVAPATIATNLATLIGLLQAGGVTQIYGIPPTKPSSAWDATYTGGRTYEPALAAILDKYRELDIPVLPVAGEDWINESLLSDGLHPNDAGNLKLAQTVIEGLAGA